MAIVRLNTRTLNAATGKLYSPPSKRAKVWGKLITGTQDTDLKARGGYALKSRFLVWDSNVAIADGDFLVVSFDGTDHLLTLDTAGNLTAVRWTEIDQRVKEGDLAEETIAAALNNTLYEIACYCQLAFRAAELGLPFPRQAALA